MLYDARQNHRVYLTKNLVIKLGKSLAYTQLTLALELAYFLQQRLPTNKIN